MQKPTLVHPGLEKRTCERDGCGEEEYREIPAEGKVGQQHTVGNFTLTITDLETRTVSITGWNGTEEEGEELTLPDTVDIGGYEFTVTGISAGAFGSGKAMLSFSFAHALQSARWVSIALLVSSAVSPST